MHKVYYLFCSLTKAKIAAGNTGKKFTPERIENIRLAQQARRALERASSTTT